MKSVQGPDHPHTLIAINNLGALLEEQGRLDEAEPLYREDLVEPGGGYAPKAALYRAKLAEVEATKRGK